MQRLIFVVVFLLCLSCRCIKSFHSFRNQALLPYKYGYRSLCSVQTLAAFEKLPQWLIDSCHSMGYIEPTDVQQLALPAILEGKDVVLQAQTGSGKTLSYALPLLSKIDPSRAAIQAVVVLPTRELGFQVSSVLKQLATGSALPITIMSVVEGSKNRRQMLWATAEPPHIVVGNPRSLQRLVDIGKLRLNAVDMVVIDEVDACLIEHDTRQELHRLLSRHLSSTYTTTEEVLSENMKESRVYRDHAKTQEKSMGLGAKYRLQRQTILCSATIPQRQHFAMNCYKNGWTASLPVIINVSQDQLVPAHVRHEHIDCAPELRAACLSYILRSELCHHTSSFTGTTVSATSGTTVTILGVPTERSNVLSEDSSVKQAIVFLDRDGVDEVDALCGLVERDLLRARHSEQDTARVGVLLETMSLDARAQTLQDFRDGRLQVLLCTDMAARGLDIPSTVLVVQMSLPNRVEQYLHRAGRTGRLQRPGKVVTFTSPAEAFVVQRFSNELGAPIYLRKLKKAKSN